MGRLSRPVRVMVSAGSGQVAPEARPTKDIEKLPDKGPSAVAVMPSSRAPPMATAQAPRDLADTQATPTQSDDPLPLKQQVVPRTRAPRPPEQLPHPRPSRRPTRPLNAPTLSQRRGVDRVAHTIGSEHDARRTLPLRQGRPGHGRRLSRRHRIRHSEDPRRLGARIAVAATSERAHTRAEELRGLGIEAYGVVADLTDEEQVARACEQVASALAPVTVLVNNAGMTSVTSPALGEGAVTESGLLGELTLQQWRRSLSRNVDTAFLDHPCRPAGDAGRLAGGGW